jgi:hypothetical protein
MEIECFRKDEKKIFGSLFGKPNWIKSFVVGTPEKLVVYKSSVISSANIWKEFSTRNYKLLCSNERPNCVTLRRHGSSLRDISLYFELDSSFASFKKMYSLSDESKDSTSAAKASALHLPDFASIFHDTNSEYSALAKRIEECEKELSMVQSRRKKEKKTVEWPAVDKKIKAFDEQIALLRRIHASAGNLV